MEAGQARAAPMCGTFGASFQGLPRAKNHAFLARMPIFRTLLAFGLVCALLAAPTQAASAKKKADQKQAAYKGAIVLEAASGKVLFEENADLVNPPASMTKLMTFAVLKDRIAAGALSLDTEVSVTASDSGIGGTQVWLKEGEKFTVEELIYAMMIQSANDAAHALARTAAGSADAFVALMNAKARELGMTRTVFKTPHGLPPGNRVTADGDLTTPRDFAKLGLYLVQRTDIQKYSSVRTRDFGPPQRLKAVVMNNHNKLLGKVAGVDGLKTGYTGGAGYCIAVTAERNGRRVVAVTMGGSDSKMRDLQVTELIESGFASLPPPPVISTGGAAPVPAPAAAASPLKTAPLTAAERARSAPTRPAQAEEPLIKLPPIKK